MSNKITFTCAKEGCNKRKKIYKSVYYRSIKHYCSRKCSGKEEKAPLETFKDRWEKMEWA